MTGGSSSFEICGPGGSSSFEICGPDLNMISAGPIVCFLQEVLATWVQTWRRQLDGINHSHVLSKGPQSQREAKESGVILTMNQRSLTRRGRKCGHEDKKEEWTEGSTPGPEVSTKDNGNDKVLNMTMSLDKGGERRKRFWSWRGKTKRPQC